MARDDRLERILALVRERGGRVTVPRRAIVAALLEADHHVTAEDLAEAVQRQYPEIHQSTVYRTLETLTSLGVVDHAHFDHGPAVYHFTDQPHNHLVCKRCGRVVELPADVLAGIRAKVAREYDFDLDPTHFALAGYCLTCRSSVDG